MQVIDGTFADLAREYLASSQFAKYADSSKVMWGRYLRLAAEPERLGSVSLQIIRPSIVQGYLDGMEGKPGKQQATLSAIKQLECWAMPRDLLPRDITKGVKAERSDGGHIPWADVHVALVEKHGRADFKRVITLGANTGQRSSDLIRMGWSDIEIYKGVRGINVTQKKTGRRIWIPITAHLATAMESWERLPGPFCRKLDGSLWKSADLRMAWHRHRNSNRQLEELKREGLVLHGLRGHACVRLLRVGANTRQISDWVGMSEPMVARYTRFSEQKDNALATIHLLDDAKNKSRVSAG